MKKTLLAVALLLASTGVFAQVNVTDNNATMKSAVSHKTVKDLNALKGIKHNTVKANPEGTELLCDFSDPSAYTFGVTSRHTSPGTRGHWQLKADTNSVIDGTAILNNFFGLGNGGYRYLENSSIANMSAHNGFAFVDWYSLYSTDHQNNTIFDAYVQLNNPISTYGMSGVDIYLSQWCYCFNQEKYYIEWSHTPDFAVKDSVEFNIKNVDVSSNEWIYGTIRVNLPSGTSNCELISTNPNELTYIRIRVYAPADNIQPHGYFYLLDDIAYAEAPARRMDILSTNWYNGYSQIPAIITPDTLAMQAVVSNTGSEDLTNVTLKNNMLQGNYVTEDSLVYSFVESNESTPTNVSYAPYSDTTLSQTGTIISIDLRRLHYLNAVAKPQTNAGVGTYDIATELYYANADGSWDTTIAATRANTHYNVVDSLVSIPNAYRWARDCSGTTAIYAFKHSLTEVSGQVYVSDEGANTSAGYKVCSGYSAVGFANNQPVYARGVEVVPAVDRDTTSAANLNVVAGARIKGSLMHFVNEATTWEEAIANVLDENEEPIASSVYVVSEADRNISTNDSIVTGSKLKTIYLPFTNGSTQLSTDVIYYACYELVTDGHFAVAQDYPYSNIFGCGNSIYTIIRTPGISESNQYSWGTTLSPSFLGWTAPMIRLIVSPVAQNAGINEVAENTASVSLYPNPVANNTQLTYTLANAGNVVINVTDIMGRNVITMDKGNQAAGIDYKANIDVKNLANGTYFCTVNVNGVKTTSKFVVNK